MFWESATGIVLTVCGILIALAGGARSAIYLWQRARSRQRAVVEWWDERKRQRKAFAALVQEDNWPNGSKNLPDSLSELYTRTDNMWTVLSHIWRIVEPNHVEVSRLSRPDAPIGTPDGF